MRQREHFCFAKKRIAMTESTQKPKTNSSPILERHPLDHDNVTKIALSEAASAALRALGKHVLVVAAEADCTVPESLRGRMILLCVPCPMETLNDAYRVVRGTHAARPLRRPVAAILETTTAILADEPPPGAGQKSRGFRPRTLPTRTNLQTRF